MADEAVQKPGIMRVLWRCLWEWNFRPVGEAVESEWETVKKSPTVLIVCALAGGLLGSYLRGMSADSVIREKSAQLDGLEGRLQDVKDVLNDTKREKDKYEIQLAQARDAVAPWMQLANSKFGDQPPDKRLEAIS